jgi:hypothetical protein
VVAVSAPVPGPRPGPPSGFAPARAGVPQPGGRPGPPPGTPTPGAQLSPRPEPPTGGPTAGPSGPPGDAAGTVVALDGTVARLADLDTLPVGEHVARYDALHGELSEALAAIDGV